MASSILPTSIQNIKEKIPPSLDVVMIFDCFLFFLTFWIVAFEKDVDKNYAARSWLWYVNSLFILDLFFRLLSIKVESIKREYWNHIIPCLFTLIIWMLVAFYDFNDVFGSKPTQGFNIFIFIVYHIGLSCYLFFYFKTSIQEESSVNNN